MTRSTVWVQQEDRMNIRLAIDGEAPVRKSFLVFGKPCLGEEEISEVAETMRSGWIGTGKRVLEFEKAFAQYVGCKHAVAVSSCTAALHLAVLVSRIGHGDEVITTPMTFAATATAILHAGAKPVFVDIREDTLNIDPEQIAAALTKNTKAVLPVHFGGLACDLDAIGKIARKHHLVIIEDAAHAVGTRYKGRMVGNHGNLACFSFYPNKNITTCEGGMVTMDSEDAAEKLRVLRLHGLSSDAWKRFESKELIRSELVELGFKYNLTDLQAAMGIHQLRKIEKFLETRERYAATFDEAFQGMRGVGLQSRLAGTEGMRHGLHLYILLIDKKAFKVDRDHIIRALRAENVGVGIHYRALHLHKYFRENFGFKKGQFPVAERVSESTMSLPLSPAMSEGDVRDVIKAVRKVLDYYRK